MITVLTTAIPKRFGMLAEALESVRLQTLLPHCHITHVDYYGLGTVGSLNRILNAVETPYIACLADDDVLYPNHLEKLRDAIGDDMVAFSFCDCDDQIPHVDFDGTNWGKLAIPATCLIRTDAVREVGGWTTDPHEGNSREDWRMWNAIRAQFGERFVCVPEITWKYRFHGDNQSRNGIQGIL